MKCLSCNCDYFCAHLCCTKKHAGRDCCRYFEEAKKTDIKTIFECPQKKKAQSQTDGCFLKNPKLHRLKSASNCAASESLFTHIPTAHVHISAFSKMLIKSSDRMMKKSSVMEMKGQKKGNRDVKLQSKSVSAVFSTMYDTVWFLSTMPHTRSLLF